MLFRHVGTNQGNELTRNSSGNTRPQSSQLVEPLWSDPGVKSGIIVPELISTLKKKKSAGGECIAEPSAKMLAERKSHRCSLVWIISSVTVGKLGGYSHLSLVRIH